ncbi:hypothetical protein Asulf_01865 [Archaeoglobus sulfaticallidus PM70-1]|uniref:Response regulatory domain-containing protein n=1 Tax=Archaeoglobus sulfaticallidus PM70-1 TaxID=387631 RepID=N0BFM7_9EURY|nr:response regulator [Archaeoglobus sulfaticallidus]AGK61833.1 hypothetical protein Asulf_01865 [Archaeoglobus sulfaticallidus PM70-1]
MKRVLIVDDDPLVRSILKSMLSKEYKVYEAENGKEAIALYKVYKPDLVLMDVVMPEMDGIKASEMILKIDPNAKIIGVTAYAKGKGKELVNAGALEVLEKPITRERLSERMRKYL